MDEIAPQWLSTEFLTQCLQDEYDYQNVVVTDFTTIRALPLGEQYLSCPIRVKVLYKRKDSNLLHSLPLIVKSELKEGLTKDMVSSLGCKESSFYRLFLPKAYALVGFGLAARSFFSPNPSIIVLEDLKDKGFSMCDKMKRLDFDHCRLYISAVTTLHAVSFAVHEAEPTLIELFKKENMFANDSPMSNSFITMGNCGMKCLAEYTETSDKFKKYTTVIRDTAPKLWDMVIDAIKSAEGLKTLNHGDSWTNNLMFKYKEDGSVAEIKLVDFQLVRYASPIIDLVYFVWSSVNDDVRRHRLDELYQLYVDQLNYNLKRVNCDVTVSYEEVKREVLKLSPLAIWMVTISVPFLCENSIQELEPFLEQGSEATTYKTYKLYFSQEKFRMCVLPKILEQLEVAGVFDYLEKYKK